ncbi:hypothetical protein, partial [Streptomyces halstedii]|uniref:hypothetical protein n=1 Tax=Streptomyces halstedii TaxID=1944 RepID=UPI0036C6A6AC
DADSDGLFILRIGMGGRRDCKGDCGDGQQVFGERHLVFSEYAKNRWLILASWGGAEKYLVGMKLCVED